MTHGRNSKNAAKKQRIRKRLFRESKGLCSFCNRLTVLPAPGASHCKPITATIEHVTRLADGGTWHHHNLKLACYECNQERNKAAIALTEAQQKYKPVIVKCSNKAATGGHVFSKGWDWSDKRP